MTSASASPQATMFNSADLQGHTFYAAKWLPSGKFLYESHKNVAAFCEKLKNLPQNELVYGEIHREGKSVCEYYDIDEKQEGQDIDDWLMGFVDERNAFCKTTGDAPINEKDLTVFEACNDKKFSLHILVRNKTHFSTIGDHKLWASKFQDHLVVNHASFAIDVSVYNKNSVLRCFGCHKPNDVTRSFNAHGEMAIDDINYAFCSSIENNSRERTMDKKIKTTIVDIPNVSNQDVLALFFKLDAKRWDNRDDWMKLIWLGDNLGLSRSELLSLSAQSYKHDDDAVDVLLDGKQECSLTIGTLYYYLKQDLSAEEYQALLPKRESDIYTRLDRIFEDEIKLKITLGDRSPAKKKSFEFTDGAIADAFKIVFGGKFIFSKGVVFSFNGVYWKPDNATKSGLKQFVDKDFASFLVDYLQAKITFLSTVKCDDEDKMEGIQNKIASWIDAIAGVKNRLRSSKGRNAVIGDICDTICDDEKVWNANPYLFVFNNCVFDLKTGEKTEGKANDFMNKCCGWNYNDNYDPANVVKFKTMLDSIQPDKNVLDYLLQVYASCMVGEQTSDIFIFTGSGGNGKSVLNELLQEMLGQYSYSLPQSFIAKPIKEGANPEAAAIESKRMCISGEPDAKSPICCSTIKKFSGDYKINARDLYASAANCLFLVVATLIIECNTAPKLDESNDAMMRRLKRGVIPFTQKFVCQREYDDASEGERKRDNLHVGDDHYKTNQFKDDNKQALFMVVLPYIQVWLNQKFNNAPDAVVKASRVYLAGSDNVFEWFEDNYEKDEDGMVFVKDLYFHYKGEALYDLPKAEQRKMGTLKKFEENLTSNIFIRKIYRERDTYFNGVQHKKPYVVGYRKKPDVVEDDDEGVDEYDSDAVTDCC